MSILPNIKSLKKPEIRSLTGLRGIAALYVVAFHYNFSHNINETFKNFLDHGYLAVDIFFVLSGFVMALTYKHLFEGKLVLKNYRLFLGRRLARIYPIYLIMTMFAIIVFSIWPGKNIMDIPLTGVPLIANLTLTQSWDISKSYVAAGWSVSTEVVAYLIFPILVNVVLAQKPAVVVICGFVAVVLLYIITFNGNIPQNNPTLNIWEGDTPVPLMKCLVEFVLGLVSYRMAYTKVFSSGTNTRWILPVCVIGICVLLTIPHSDFFVVLLFPCLIASLVADQGLISRTLASSPVYFFGEISYSLYLIHFAAISFRGEFQDIIIDAGVPHAFTVSQLCFVMISIGIATLMYRFLEKPSREHLRKYF